MAMTVFLCGHGEWKPDNGFTQLPKDCTFTFYTHNAKTMLQDAVLKIVAGADVGEPEMQVVPFKMVQNMTLHPESPDCVLGTKEALLRNPNKANSRIYFARRAITVADFLKRHGHKAHGFGGMNLVWTCCRYIPMAGAKSGAAGFNASEDIVGDQYLWRDDDRTIFKVTPR